MGVSVLLYTNAPILAMGVKKALEGTGYELTYEPNLDAILTLAGNYDVVVLGLEQDEIDMEAVAMITAKTKTMMWVHHTLNLLLAHQAKACGACAILWRTSSIKEFLHCLNSVRIDQDFFEKKLESDLETIQVVELTDAQKKLAWLLGCGFSNKDIAAILNISENTVKAHFRVLYPKAHVNTRTELAVLIIDNGYRPDYKNGGKIGSIPSLMLRQRKNPRITSVRRSA
jgi:DNA-binding NarL/FixJ family response regulator